MCKLTGLKDLRAVVNRAVEGLRGIAKDLLQVQTSCSVSLHEEHHSLRAADLLLLKYPNAVQKILPRSCRRILAASLVYVIALADVFQEVKQQWVGNIA